jgi:hypothetical protein
LILIRVFSRGLEFENEAEISPGRDREHVIIYPGANALGFQSTGLALVPGSAVRYVEK